MKAKDEEEHASISELRRSEWREERPEWTFVQGLRHYPRDVAGLLKKKQPFLGGTMYEKLMVNGGNPMNRSTPGLPVHHQLPEFTQTNVHRVDDAIQPSHPLPSSSPPALTLSLHDALPIYHSTPGLPVHHHLPEFTQTHIHRVDDAIQPSHPLSSPSPPAPKIGRAHV